MSYFNEETIEGTDKWITDAAVDKDEINQAGEDMTENILVWPNMLHNNSLNTPTSQNDNFKQLKVQNITSLEF